MVCFQVLSINFILFLNFSLSYFYLNKLPFVLVEVGRSLFKLVSVSSGHSSFTSLTKPTSVESVKASCSQILFRNNLKKRPFDLIWIQIQIRLSTFFFIFFHQKYNTQNYNLLCFVIHELINRVYQIK